MEKEFVPYELALKLKEIEFKNNYNFKEYDTDGYLQHTGLLESHQLESIDAPLWEQALNWFREKYKFKVGIGINNKGLYYDYKIVLFNTTDVYYKDCYNTYEEARLACLEKLIELVENEKNK